mgnify:CR=1 FL=1
MQIVILAWWLGTRLRPITETIPKPMVEVNNKPFLEYQILMLKKYWFKKILMLIGYKGEMIENYFQDGEKYWVKIEYSYEGDELLWTWWAIRNAYSKLEDNFIVINGDTYLDYDYHHMIDLYQKSDLAWYFTVLNNVKYDKSNPNLNNNLRVENGLVKDYIKGINDPKFKYSDSGVYLLHKKILETVVPHQKQSLESDVLMPRIKKWLIGAFEVNALFYDIGTFERLELFKNVIV